MSENLRDRLRDERGYSMIEILGVLVIIGILASIAVPSFLNQREKSHDTCAKSMLLTMQTAMEAYGSEHDISYSEAGLTALHEVENQIPKSSACGGTSAQTPVVGVGGDGKCTSSATTARSYCVGMISVSGKSFALHRLDDGSTARVCGSTAGGTNGGGCHNGSW